MMKTILSKLDRSFFGSLPVIVVLGVLTPSPTSRTTVSTSFDIRTAGLLLASVGVVFAEVRYVDVNSTNATPLYTHWAIAAASIQDAVDGASLGPTQFIAPLWAVLRLVC